MRDPRLLRMVGRARAAACFRCPLVVTESFGPAAREGGDGAIGSLTIRPQAPNACRPRRGGAPLPTWIRRPSPRACRACARARARKPRRRPPIYPPAGPERLSSATGRRSPSNLDTAPKPSRVPCVRACAREKAATTTPDLSPPAGPERLSSATGRRSPSNLDTAPKPSRVPCVRACAREKARDDDPLHRREQTCLRFQSERGRRQASPPSYERGRSFVGKRTGLSSALRRRR